MHDGTKSFSDLFRFRKVGLNWDQLGAEYEMRLCELEASTSQMLKAMEGTDCGGEKRRNDQAETSSMISKFLFS